MHDKLIAKLEKLAKWLDKSHHERWCRRKDDERKRLRNERLLRAEQRAKDERDRDDDMQEQFTRILAAFERIADVMELWADQQEPLS